MKDVIYIMKVIGVSILAIFMLFGASIAPEYLALEYKNQLYLLWHLAPITWILYEWLSNNDKPQQEPSDYPF